jgi:hypothetical protein
MNFLTLKMVFPALFPVVILNLVDKRGDEGALEDPGAEKQGTLGYLLSLHILIASLVGGRVTGLGDGQSKVTPNFTQAIKIISIAFVVRVFVGILLLVSLLGHQVHRHSLVLGCCCRYIDRDKLNRHVLRNLDNIRFRYNRDLHNRVGLVIIVMVLVLMILSRIAAVAVVSWAVVTVVCWHLVGGLRGVVVVDDRWVVGGGGGAVAVITLCIWYTIAVISCH